MIRHPYDIHIRHTYLRLCLQSSLFISQSSVLTSVGRFAKKRKRFDSIRFTALSEPPRQSTPGVLDSDPEATGSVHRSHDRPARITTELLIAFAEVSSDIAANVSHDAILQHTDARS